MAYKYLLQSGQMQSEDFLPTSSTFRRSSAISSGTFWSEVTHARCFLSVLNGLRKADNNLISGFLGPPSGQDAGGEARTRGREVPADLRADLSAEDNSQRFSMNIARPLTLPKIMRRANVPSLPRGSQIEHRHCAEISSSNT
ncbi:hypothetical protein PoB_003178900 [Plakobranchus ocellatus]|uniref:Uncharacterized protein n=1 Tax=Plakobranchus ocellatus TaxID=259542 RepID=A0AAV4ACC7_9GAST|nr:hypothetical protein PoB_003178900 [Plakobranchus ocellatus]